MRSLFGLVSLRFISAQVVDDSSSLKQGMESEILARNTFFPAVDVWEERLGILANRLRDYDVV